MKTQQRVCKLMILLLCFLYSCEKTPALNSFKEIISFDLKKADGTSFQPGEISIKIFQDSVIVTVPYSTNRNPLTPYFTITGLTILPASGVAQNFSIPVQYTVTAQDQTKRVYTVVVKPNNSPPGFVYFGNDNTFYALDAVTGKLAWKYESSASFAYSSATYSNETIYVGGIDNKVYAFNAKTGAVRWEKTIATTGIESDAVFVDGTIYVGTNDDYLYALDATNGTTKWRFLTGANVSASPTVWNGTVYFGSSDGKLYALNASTGELKWQYQTGAMINQSGPALVNGVIYVGSRDSYLYAINASNGSLVWRFYANGISLEQSSPTVANNIVYIGAWYNILTSEKGCFYAINATTGQLFWKQLNNTGVSSSPTVTNGIVYITADDMKIHAMNAATGTSIWQKEILPNSASPAVSDNIVYVGGGGTRYFYAFDANNGNEKWRFLLNGYGRTSCPLIIKVNGDPDYAGDSGLLQ